MRWLDMADLMDMSLSASYRVGDGQGKLGVLQSMGSQSHGQD